VQTLTPDHPCIALAAKHDFVSFAGQELVHRKQHQYPPFQRLARLIVRSEKEDAAAQFSETLSVAFTEAIKRSNKNQSETDQQSLPPLRVLGPTECPVFRLKGYYRFHCQVQSADSGVLHAVLRDVLAIAKPPSGVEFQVDVDPYNML
jgi:primosomal protein N' (replication factor Y)